MKKGELVRASENGNYGDPEWAGALCLVLGHDSNHPEFTRVRRLSDGKKGSLRTAILERADV